MASCVRPRSSRAELWKIGQLKAGRHRSLRAISLEEAARASASRSAEIASSRAARAEARADRAEPRHLRIAARTRPACVVSPGGRRLSLVEYGPHGPGSGAALSRHALMEWFVAAHFPDPRPDPRHSLAPDSLRRKVLARERLLEPSLGPKRVTALDDIEVPSRIVHLPLSWDDPSTRLAIRKYMQSVRADAPGARATSSSSGGSMV